MHSPSDAHYDQGNYGAGYMQTNPSYNIDIGGGVQDNYSQYGGYGTGGGSSSGQYRNRTGGGYDAESRHTSGGLQRTDDFSNYQSYDNSGTSVAHSVNCTCMMCLNLAWVDLVPRLLPS